MLEQVKKVIMDAISVEEELITPQARLSEDLGIDSLSAVELSLELETEFDIRIEDEEISALVTVQDILDLVNSKKQ
ncbi:MAG: acyl carrier protein [Oscillospiraceae bacterium]|nr:acyl carrier protein [Oscillospiraceae bacterium]